MKSIVIPGDLLFPYKQTGDFYYVENGKTYSSIVGIFDSEKKILIPLEGVYFPKVGDTIIGIITDVRFSNYLVDTNSPFEGIVFSKFVKFPLNIGEVIEAEVKGIEGTEIILQNVKRLMGGKLIEIKPSKIPRVIGKGRSMLELIEKYTNTKLTVGLNGRIWIKGENIAKAAKAIIKIEKEAHVSGLTERITKFLEE